MKKIIFLSLIFITTTSCNLTETFEKLNKLEAEIENEFNHSDISISYNFGTEENDNYYQITFYDYDISDKTHSELKNKANMVNSFFKKKNTKNVNLDFIEVRFTELKIDNADSFVNFKFD